MIENRYQTFWNRFFAGLIDGIILIVPFIIVEELIPAENISAQLWFDVVQIVVCAVYTIIGHGKFGQTVGKRVMKIKVLNLEENGVIGLPRAFYRESIWLFLSLAIAIYFIFNISKTNLSASEYLLNCEDISGITSLSWLAIELITMLTNNKRRAIHDFMAGSVVVKTSKQELQ